MFFIHLPKNHQMTNALLSIDVKPPLKDSLRDNFCLKHNRRSLTSLHVNDKDEGGEDDDNGTLMDQINKFLDTPIINLEDDKEDGNVNWFTKLLKSDYELAEALYTSAFLTIMVVLSQELLRMQMYGENYVPFKAGGGGRLF